MKETGEDMEGRLNSVSQIYAQRQIPENVFYGIMPGIWVNTILKGHYNIFPMSSANVGSIFGSRNLIPLIHVELQIQVMKKRYEIS